MIKEARVIQTILAVPVGQYVSTRHVIKYLCANGHQVSERTVQRDLARCGEFGVKCLDRGNAKFWTRTRGLE